MKSRLVIIASVCSVLLISSVWYVTRVKNQQNVVLETVENIEIKGLSELTSEEKDSVNRTEMLGTVLADSYMVNKSKTGGVLNNTSLNSIGEQSIEDMFNSEAFSNKGTISVSTFPDVDLEKVSIFADRVAEIHQKYIEISSKDLVLSSESISIDSTAGKAQLLRMSALYRAQANELKTVSVPESQKIAYTTLVELYLDYSDSLASIVNLEEDPVRAVTSLSELDIWGKEQELLLQIADFLTNKGVIS